MDTARPSNAEPGPRPADVTAAVPAPDAAGEAPPVGEAALVAQFLAAEQRFQLLLDDCVAGQPALSRQRLAALSGFLDDAAWRGVEALETLQQRPVRDVAAAVLNAAPRRPELVWRGVA